MSQTFEPGVYVKGDNAKRVETKADAVAAVFEGYVLEAPAEPADEVEPSTSATPDEPSGEPVDASDPSRSYSDF